MCNQFGGGDGGRIDAEVSECHHIVGASMASGIHLLLHLIHEIVGCVGGVLFPKSIDKPLLVVLEVGGSAAADGARRGNPDEGHFFAPEISNLVAIVHRHASDLMTS